MWFVVWQWKFSQVHLISIHPFRLSRRLGASSEVLFYVWRMVSSRSGIAYLDRPLVLNEWLLFFEWRRCDLAVLIIAPYSHGFLFISRLFNCSRAWNAHAFGSLRHCSWSEGSIAVSLVKPSHNGITEQANKQSWSRDLVQKNILTNCWFYDVPSGWNRSVGGISARVKQPLLDTLRYNPGPTQRV